jgi:hypothetical protein
MISRREVVTASVLGTLVGAGSAEVAAIQQDVQFLKESLKNIEDKLGEIKTALDQGLRGPSTTYGSVGTVRAKFEQYAKVTGKSPDYCDVGITIFYDVYDWHVRNQQQIQMTRVGERLVIQFMFTQLILRWENDFNYVGTPFDR